MVFEEAVNSLDKHEPTLQSRLLKQSCVSADLALR